MRGFFVVLLFLVAISQTFLLKAQARVEIEPFNSLYFDREWSARSEAMGRTGVAFSNGNFNASTNPALFAFSNSNLLVDANSSNPFFLLDEGKFQFFGISGSPFKKLHIGLNRASIDYGEYEIQVSPEEPGRAFSSKEFVTTLSVAYLFSDNFSLGFNLNQIKTEYSGITEKKLYIDVGLAYQLGYTFFETDNTFGIGVNFENASSEILTVESQEYFLDIDPSGNGVDESIPSNIIKVGYAIPKILTFGVSNELLLGGSFFNNSFNTIGLLTTVEYQEVLNSRLNHRTSIGQEIRILNTFIFRFGYYVQRNRPDSEIQNKQFHKEFTYGFGLSIPFSRITKNSIPATIRVDYTRLPQPFGSKNIPFGEKKFTSFGVSLAFNF